MESDTRLVDAAEQNHLATVDTLLEADVDVNTPQVDGMTTLHWAVYHDNLALTRRLVVAGALAQVTSRCGVTPVSLACQNGNGKIVRLLLESGADSGTRMRGGETALMIAARTGKVEPIDALLAHRADVNTTEARGQTALMWAAAEGHVDVVRRLTEAGADVHVRLRSGFTATFFAVREGHTDVVKILLDSGVGVNDVLLRPEEFDTENEEGVSALLLAVENGHFELAQSLLEAGADPNDERSGLTVLHAITRVRKTGRGDGSDGDPPPDGSGSLTSLELVRSLVAHGADVNRRLKNEKRGRGRLTRKGATPFLTAAWTADLPLLRTLLDLGADSLLPNVENSTPLVAAAGMGTRAPGEEPGSESECLEVLRLLLELGSDVNVVDDSGETAMHGAAYKNAPRIVEFLAECGARIDIWNRKNKHGWTPLIIAEGFRPGNFKPSPPTVAAFYCVMRAAGVTPPKPTPRSAKKPTEYEG